MGKTREAMEFYASVFDGKLTMQTYADGGMPCKPEEAHLIMHAELRSPDIMFMAADGNSEHTVSMGDNIKMSLSGDDEEKLTRYFNALSVGGTVSQPLMKAPWGDTFGMLVDKFGVHWMVDVGMKK